jgi:hypothetical protein
MIVNRYNKYILCSHAELWMANVVELNESVDAVMISTALS